MVREGGPCTKRSGCAAGELVGKLSHPRQLEQLGYRVTPEPAA
jgi:hypothetical protein